MSQIRRFTLPVLTIAFIAFYCGIVAFAQRPTTSTTFAPETTNSVETTLRSGGNQTPLASIPTTDFHPGLVRIDFSITTAQPTFWEGELQLSRGEFGGLVPLGVNATSSVNFSFSNGIKNKLELYNRAPTTFCGVETTIFAPLDARLEIKLADRTIGKTLVKTVFVERLLDSSIKIPFDEQGNGIEIVRVPADELPIQFERLTENGVVHADVFSYNEGTVSTVFQPGEPFRLATTPRSSTSKIANDLLLTVSIQKREQKAPLRTESREISLEEFQKIEQQAGNIDSSTIPYLFDLSAPETEGVFDVVLELSQKASVAPKATFSLPTGSKQKEHTLLARRIVQGVVVSRKNKNIEKVPSDDAQAVSTDEIHTELLETIDPTNPSWRKTFSKKTIIPFRKPLGSKNEKPSFGTNRLTFAPSERKSTQEDASLMTGEDDSIGKYANNVVLGQTNDSNVEVAPSFGKNLLGLVQPKINGNADKNASSINLQQAAFLKRWNQDRFQSFTRTLDRRLWGVASDLWEKQLGSSSSRPLDPIESSQIATSPTNFLRLAPNGNDSDSISWEAYPIPINEPGKPHLLEIEYPANVPQKLAVSIIEQSITGGLFPSSLDEGFVVASDPLSDQSSDEVARYKVLFWPKTKTPIVLLTNCSNQTAAIYGQIRIYRAGDREPKVVPERRGRVFGMAITTPNICDQFSSLRKPSQFGIVGSEDWNSFDEAISRTLYYMDASKINAMIVAVVSNGSSLYPSSRLNPSTLYDGGLYLTTGGDVVRKDVLAVALTKFERYGRSFIPLVNLNSPLPLLEARLKKLRTQSVSSEERSSTEGIEWIGVDRRKLIDSRQQIDGTGPYYNVLHPYVEEEVLAIVKELASRCAPFNSFGGLALDVGANGWLALPDDVYYGMDDETITRFVRESNLQEVLSRRSERRVQELLLAKGDGRYRLRAEFIRDNCLNEWIEWRNDALYRFYQKVRSVISTVRPDSRLYLVATNSLDGPICRSLLYPSLTTGSKLRDALRLVGLDPVRFASKEKRKDTFYGVSQVGYVTGDPSRNKFDDAITLLRPEIVSPTKSSYQTALTDEFSVPDSIALFNGLSYYPGALFYHKPEKIELHKFNELSPIQPSFVELSTRALPAGYENRRRFARALSVEDALCFFDGGELAPIMQDESTQNWIQVFQNLPDVVFKTWNPKTDVNVRKTSENNPVETPEDKSIQPLVVRYTRNEKETWIYILNGAPFHLGTKLTLKRRPNAEYEIFDDQRHEEPTLAGETFLWTFTASPYDLVALRIEDPKVTIENVEVSLPMEICGTEGRLQETVQDFVDRVLAAKSGIIHPLRNGDFEESFTGNDSEPSLTDYSTNVSTTSDSVPQQNSGSKDDRSNLLGLEMPKMNLFKKNGGKEPSTENASRTVVLEDQNLSSIPGWRAFGPGDVDVQLDPKVVYSGQASLRISSSQSVGGIVCQPFIAPTSGRLCAQMSFGIPSELKELPLNVCLTGRQNGRPFTIRIPIGNSIIKKSQKLNGEDVVDNVIWVRDMVLFDRLPLEGLDDLSLRFELCGAGTVWIDQIRLFKLAFADDEQNELMKFINTAEFRASKDRMLDVMFMLDNYWVKMLQEQIPDNSPLLASRERRPSNVAAVPQEEQTEKTPNKGFLNRTINRLKFW